MDSTVRVGDYQNRAREESTTTCPLCTHKLDDKEDKRGVVEFFDGWFWVCSKCKAKVGKEFDCTQHTSYGEGTTVYGCKRSRKHNLKWLEKEHQITIS